MNKTVKCFSAVFLAVLVLLSACVGCSKDEDASSQYESSVSTDSRDESLHSSDLVSDSSDVGQSDGESDLPASDDVGSASEETSSSHSFSDTDSGTDSTVSDVEDSVADSNTESNTESAADSNTESNTESVEDSNTESITDSSLPSEPSESESVSEPEDSDSSEESVADRPSDPETGTDAKGNTVISLWATDYYGGDATGKLTVTAPAEVTAGEKFTVSFKWTDYAFDTGYVGAFTFVFSLDTRYVTLARGNISDVEIVGKTTDWTDVCNFGKAAKEASDKSKANLEPVSISMATLDKDECSKKSFTVKVEFIAVHEGNCVFAWDDWGIEFCDLRIKEILTHSMDGCDFTVKVRAAEEPDRSSSAEVTTPVEPSSEEPSSEEESVVVLPEYIDGKRVYGIKTFDSLGAISWDSVEKADIDTYKWVQSVEYEAYAQLVFVKDYGFVCRMTCIESDPLANYTQFGDPVYLDSCMEFFAKWDNKSYINIESNSKGALCCQFGAAKAGRKPAIDYLPLSQMFETNPVVENGKWTLTMEIPIAKLQKFYGSSLTADTFTSGYQFTGNFYKIGSDAVTGVRHYGMWNEVKSSSPDFHRPKDFGIFIMI